MDIHSFIQQLLMTLSSSNVCSVSWHRSLYKNKDPRPSLEFTFQRGVTRLEAIVFPLLSTSTSFLETLSNCMPVGRTTFQYFNFPLLGGDHWKGMPQPSPEFGMYILHMVPWWEPFSGTQPLRRWCCGDHLDCLQAWALLSLRYKLLRFWQAGAEIHSSLKENHVCKLPCLPSLPSTSLEWLPFHPFLSALCVQGLVCESFGRCKWWNLHEIYLHSSSTHRRTEMPAPAPELFFLTPQNL